MSPEDPHQVFQANSASTVQQRSKKRPACDDFLFPSVQSDQKLSLCAEYHVKANNVPLSPGQSGSGISSHTLLSDFANNYTLQQFPRPRIYWAKKSVSKFQKDQLELLVAGLEIRAIAMIWKTLYSWALIAIDRCKFSYLESTHTLYDLLLIGIADSRSSRTIKNHQGFSRSTSSSRMRVEIYLLGLDS